MKKKSNIIFWAVVLVVALLAAYSVIYKNKSRLQNEGVQAPKTANSTSITQKSTAKEAVPDFSLKDLNGKTIKLSDYKGKVVFLNFWATWCPYCVQEMPELNEASRELAKGGNAVILAVDVNEPSDKVKKFVADKKITLPVLLDADGAVAQYFNISGLPTTVIINKDGTLSDAIVGATNKQTILDAVNKLK